MTPELFAGGDTAPFAALHATSFPDAWSARAIAELLVTPGTFIFHVTDGFVMARAAGGEAEILTLAVMPEARGRGHGRVLVLAAAARAHSLGANTLFLEVASDNEAARKLYAGLGFQRAGMRKAYYAGRDAHVLKAPLPLPG